ncbi:MAG: ROK family protein [Woeseiaceae bacterium]|nr:ROK family protein [Woeseiaceae bacterium]
MHILGIDIGGSGIKGAIVDTNTGNLVSERLRIATPQPSTPPRVADVVLDIVQQHGYDGPVGCCMPSVVVDGQARTAANIDKSWRGTQADAVFRDVTGKAFTVLNDADAAAVAEMAIGAGRGLGGLVITVTIGTGLGSGVHYRGRLVPNVEIGHMPGKDGQSIERYASDRARKVNDLSWPEWGERFDYFLRKATRVMSPDHFILGGGASKKLELFEEQLTVDVPIHVARFRNNAGIIGAALAANPAIDTTDLSTGPGSES